MGGGVVGGGVAGGATSCQWVDKKKIWEKFWPACVFGVAGVCLGEK